jgi:hypothetical protein
MRVPLPLFRRSFFPALFLPRRYFFSAGISSPPVSLPRRYLRFAVISVSPLFTLTPIFMLPLYALPTSKSRHFRTPNSLAGLRHNALVLNDMPTTTHLSENG